MTNNLLPVNTRNYNNDLRFLNETKNEQESNFMRGVQIALPFLALYQPTAYHFSLGMNMLRTSTCFSELVSKCANDGFDSYAAAETALSVASLAGTYFQHPLAGALTAGHDLIKELMQLADYASAPQTKPLLKPLLGALNQALFLMMMAGGGYQVYVALLAVNAFQSWVAASEEAQKNRNPEAAAHIIMACLRTIQFAQHATHLYRMTPNPLLDLNKELIKIFDKYGTEAKTRGVPITYVIVEKGDLHAMQMLYWANYQGTYGLLNHVLENNQQAMAHFLLDQNAYINPTDASRFILDTNGLETDAQRKAKLDMVTRLIGNNSLSLKDPFNPIYRDVLSMRPETAAHKVYQEQIAKLLSSYGAELVGEV